MIYFPNLLNFNYLFQLINSFLSQALRSELEKEAESTQSTLQTSLSEMQNSLTGTQTELSSTQSSLTQTNKAVTEAQAALSQTQSELRDSKARLEEFQTASKEQNQKLDEELKQAWTDRDAAACELHYSTVLPASLPSPLRVHTSTKTENLFFFFLQMLEIVQHLWLF